MTISSVAAIQSAFDNTFQGTKSGTISNQKKGDASFATTITNQDGVKTSNKVITYANGNTVQVDRSITQNADGSYTKTSERLKNGVETSDRTATSSADGSTLTISGQKFKADGTPGASLNETITGNTDGSENVTGTITKADGKVDTIAGTLTKADGTSALAETITNSKGNTATVDNTRTRDGNVTTDTRSGTNFKGVAFSNTVTQTLLNTQNIG